MVVIITGSRHLVDRRIIRRELLRLPINTIIIVGGASGADTIAEEEARLLNLPVLVVKADWDLFGPAAGPIRNEDMLQMLLRAKFWGDEIMVLAFHESETLGKGTKDMVTRAEKANVPTKIFIIQ